MPRKLERKVSYNKLLLIGILAISFIFATALVLVLRPIADDYCSASLVRDEGFIGSVLNQWNNWSGSLVSDIWASIFGWNIGISFGPFGYLAWVTILFLLGVSSFFFLLLNNFKQSPQTNRAVTLLVALAAFMSFITSSFGLPPSFGTNQFAIGYAMTGWMAAGVSQLLPALILLSLLGLMHLDEIQPNIKWLRLLVVFLATLIGLMNFLAALTLIISLSLLQLGKYFRSRHISLFSVLVIALAVFSIALNYFSPGTQLRKNSLSVGAEVGTLPGAKAFVNHYLDALGGQPIFLALFLGVVIGLSFRVQERVRLTQTLWVLAILFVATFIATGITEVVGFSEPWHFTQVRLTVFLLVFQLSLLSGFAINDIETVRNKYFGVIGKSSMALFIALLSVQSYLIIQQINSRTSSWDSGNSAPVGSWIADKEVSWIASCESQMRG